MKLFVTFFLLGVLSACSGLETKSLQLEIGSSKEDVLKVMGTSRYQSTQDGVAAWRYAAKVEFGYCDYREIFIFRDKVIYMNQYYNSSMAGCYIGLQEIDWGPALVEVDKLIKKESEEP